MTKWLSFIILRCASNEEKHAVRVWENATKKKVNTEQHLLFNKQCIYIYIYI